jgi:D-glycero-D-manno-heptose 1,7-bisphosphate phosphatase
VKFEPEKREGGRRAVFLDRDGVVNAVITRDGKPHPPARLEDFVLMPGVVEGCHALKRAGYLLVVATNQPDVGRGTQTQEVVEAMHQRLRNLLPVDGIEVCYHPGQGNSVCDCRKPRPGMLLRAALTHGIALEHSWMIGDRWVDVECGRAAGCHTIFVDYGYAEERPSLQDYTVKSFVSAVSVITGGVPA